MNKSETVTIPNDMCLMAPASLICPSIQWESIDSLTAKATFVNKRIRITAMVFFNERGELTNFVSDDRYESADGATYKNYRWSTPVMSYREMDGRRVAASAETVLHTPEGEFVYGNSISSTSNTTVVKTRNRGRIRPHSQRLIGHPN